VLPRESVLRGAAVERVSDSGQVVDAVSTQVGALGEVLAQQAVDVLVGSALPRAVGIAEEHRNAGVDAELGVLGHLRALVPGQ
jgi:hypothetical protein